MVTLELSLFIIVSFGIQAISLPSSKEKDKEGNVRADFFLPSILVARCRNTACFYFSYSSLLSLVLAIASCKAGTGNSSLLIDCFRIILLLYSGIRMLLL